MTALTFLLFKLNTMQKETLTNRQTLSELKPWCNNRGVLNLYHGHYTTIMTSGGFLVITQYHEVQISQSEKRNSYSVWKLNNKTWLNTLIFAVSAHASAIWTNLYTGALLKVVHLSRPAVGQFRGISELYRWVPFLAISSLVEINQSGPCVEKRHKPIRR